MFVNIQVSLIDTAIFSLIFALHLTFTCCFVFHICLMAYNAQDILCIITKVAIIGI